MYVNKFTIEMSAQQLSNTICDFQQMQREQSAAIRWAIGQQSTLPQTSATDPINELCKRRFGKSYGNRVWLKHRYQQVMWLNCIHIISQLHVGPPIASTSFWTVYVNKLGDNNWYIKKICQQAWSQHSISINAISKVRMHLSIQQVTPTNHVSKTFNKYTYP